MVLRILVALFFAAAFVKAGNEAAGSKVEKTPDNPEGKPVVADCIGKSEFLEKYKLLSYQNIVNAQPEAIVRNDGVLVFAIAYFMKEDSNPDGLDCNVLVKSRNQRTDDELNSIRSEVGFLKTLKDLKVTPTYHFCFYEYKKFGGNSYFRYHIVHEEVKTILFSEDMAQKFQSFDLPVKIYKVLQIALAIQQMHTLGITHQNINLETIVSTDAELTDVRLVDFTYAVEVGKTGFGKIGNPGVRGNNVFYSPDKLKDKSFTATFQQDAYAFAVSIIFLFDFKNTFELKIKAACPKEVETFTEKCKAAFLEKDLKITEDSKVKSLLEYLQERLYGQKEELEIGKMIEELVTVYKATLEGNGSKFAETTKKVEEVENASKTNIEAIGKLSLSIDNKNVIIV